MRLIKRIVPALFWGSVTGGVTGVMVCVTGAGCVSPYYGTARIEPGWHLNAGAAVGQFIGTFQDSNGWPYMGPRIDVEIGYAFNSHFETHFRVGGGWGWVTAEPREGESPPLDETYVAEGALGIQIAPSPQILTPALRFEIGLHGASADVMAGIGQSEWLTLGSRIYIRDITNVPFSLAPFVSIHPLRHFTVFASPGLITPYEGYSPLFSVGIGYKIK